jgi:hypothetical protein
LVNEGLLQELFVLALREASQRGDLWWQIRALEELGWYKELDALVLEHAKDIENTEDTSLLLLLARAKGDVEKSVQLRKRLANNLETATMQGDPESSETDG